jgi:hypothetical protein
VTKKRMFYNIDERSSPQKEQLGMERLNVGMSSVEATIGLSKTTPEQIAPSTESATPLVTIDKFSTLNVSASPSKVPLDASRLPRSPSAYALNSERVQTL